MLPVKDLKSREEIEAEHKRLREVFFPQTAPHLLFGQHYKWHRAELSSMPSGRRAEAIVVRVSKKTGVSPAVIKGSTVFKNVYKARVEAIALVHKHCPDWSLVRIGRFFGGRDHTTIAHALKRAEELK